MAVQVFGSCREAGGAGRWEHGGPQTILASCWGSGIWTSGLLGQGLWQTLTVLPQGLYSLGSPEKTQSESEYAVNIYDQPENKNTTGNP